MTHELTFTMRLDKLTARQLQSVARATRRSKANAVRWLVAQAAQELAAQGAAEKTQNDS